MQDNQNEKAGRVLVQFWLPDYTYAKFLKRLGVEANEEARIKSGAVNAIVKLFSLQFAAGKAGLNIKFDPVTEEIKKP